MSVNSRAVAVGWVLDPRGSSQQKSCTIAGAGPHYLLWQYIKDGSGSNKHDCGWVDHLQWTGAASASASADWEEIEYTYDPSGRRIAKDVDGVVTKYLVACPEPAEYDANDVLLRKYIYGPGVDQPICMIDVADANAAYYYHYDALGSVVALSDSAGDTVQLYEYDVYGQVAASDPNHANPFLFTGRRYDTETGLYYYRARYYNPTIGRFLQTDPIGYGDGMNMYAYCGNNPARFLDPTGTHDVEDHGYPYLPEEVHWGTDWGMMLWPVHNPTRPCTDDLIKWYTGQNGRGLLYEYSSELEEWALSDPVFFITLREAMTLFAKLELQTLGNSGESVTVSGKTLLKHGDGYQVHFDDAQFYTHPWYLIHNVRTYLDYTATVTDEGVTLTAEFIILDYMDLHPDMFHFDEVCDLIGNTLLPFAKPYHLQMNLGTHTMIWTKEGSDLKVDSSSWLYESDLVEDKGGSGYWVNGRGYVGRDGRR